MSDFIDRQGFSQKHKRVKTKSDSIQAVLASRPNQLMQVDYCYFYWANDGVDDERKTGPIDESKLSGKELTAVQKGTDEIGRIFKNKKLRYRGCIVAIDCFSRFCYTRPIEGNINSLKAKEAFESIMREANQQYPDYKLRVLQTDLGRIYVSFS